MARSPSIVHIVLLLLSDILLNETHYTDLNIIAMMFQINVNGYLIEIEREKERDGDSEHPNPRENNGKNNKERHADLVGNMRHIPKQPMLNIRTMYRYALRYFFSF